MEDTPSDNITKLRIQIEYYLSDKNLEHDKFFNEKIREDLNVNFLFKLKELFEKILQIIYLKF